jgi:hypothetical protein
MSLPNIFTTLVSQKIVSRIDAVREQAQPLWGKMDAGQMLAHCNISYEIVYEDFHGRPNLPMRLMLQYLIKPKVCSERAYKKSDRTAPSFVLSGKKDFEKEKARLISYIFKTQVLGEAEFDGKVSIPSGN